MSICIAGIPSQRFFLLKYWKQSTLSPWRSVYVLKRSEAKFDFSKNKVGREWKTLRKCWKILLLRNKSLQGPVFGIWILLILEIEKVYGLSQGLGGFFLRFSDRLWGVVWNVLYFGWRYIQGHWIFLTKNILRICIENPTAKRFSFHL